ncbi:MAG: hypothetical protein QNJ33_11850 [Crocosphaera sp.]|nr:hypothetical protein [Crocosphaera sp.]
MKLQSITYTASCNYYSDSRESITLTAELKEGDNYKDVLEQLKSQVHLSLNDLSQYRKAEDDKNQLERKLSELKDFYDEARAKFEEVKGIMQAHGINKEYPDFPDLNPKLIKALPAVDNDF